MASSTLDPDNIPEPDRQLGKGHSTRDLGPSDLSDSGSDLKGGTSRVAEADLPLDRGTNEDSDSGHRSRQPGREFGDAGLDSDSDSSGTGERASAGRDTGIEAGSDIDADRIDEINLDDEAYGDLGTPGQPIPRSRHPNRPQGRR
jgi:hypothetical protein